MKKNIGFVDTFLRVVAALAIFLMAIFGFITGTWAVILVLVGVIFLVTSMLGTCFIYLPLGLSSRRSRTED